MGGELIVGITYNVENMFKNLIFAVITSILVMQPVNSAMALDGIVKFTGKKTATVILEIADTDEKRSQGLMNRPTLGENKGMVFIFRPAKQVTFWMKDTLIPLDMIFVNKGKIVKIVKGAIPNQTEILYPSEYEVTEVVEVNGGFTENYMIEVGSSVSFENIAQIDYSGKSKLMIVPK